MKLVKENRGFTLIEMMVVILLIVILAGMVFRMVAIIGKNNDISKTRAKLEKLGHALEEYRAIYGKYPDVRFYPIFDKGKQVGIRQPFGYEYTALTGIPSSNPDGLGRQLVDLEYKGKKQIKYDVSGNNSGIFFTFGLVSYLIPRYNGTASEGMIRLAGVYGDALDKQDTDPSHAISQWRTLNSKRSGAPGDSDRDLAAVRRTLLHMDSYLKDDNKASLGSMFRVKNGDMDDGIPRPITTSVFKGTITNACVTVEDEWYHEMHYKSLPPYDTYDIWSAGPDGLTVGDRCGTAAHHSEADGTHVKRGDEWIILDGAQETDDDIHLGRD